jgi:DNA-binding beta-propeller fold protein YncE
MYIVEVVFQRMKLTAITLGLLAFCSGITCAVAASPCDLLQQGTRVEISLPLHPLMVATLRRSCALLITLSDGGEPAKGAIGVLKPGQEKLALASVLNLPSEPVGIALTTDESIAAVAGSSRVYFIDAGELLAGHTNAILGTAEYDKSPGTVSVALTRDERFLFASDEEAGTVTIIDFAAARASRFATAPVRARVTVDWSPTVLKMAADGKHVLLPVEAVRRKSKPPILCPGEPGGEAVNPVGAILSIKIAQALNSPATLEPSRSYAGCSPVRLELSKDGRTAFVTSREENVLRVMDVGMMLHGEPDAVIAKVPVGPAPIGLALADHDRLVLVSNSNRWAKEQTQQTVTLIDTAGRHRRKPVVLGTIPVGVFPRDIAISRDGRTILVSNFGSRSLTLLRVSKLRSLISRAPYH